MEEDPDLTASLIHKELQDGFVKVWPGSLEEAKVQWPLGVAVGKLGVQKAEGKEPRLTLDVTISGVNSGIQIEEKPQYLPTTSRCGSIL